MDQPPVAYYMMGDVDDPSAPGNEWRTVAAWPPPGAMQSWYLHADGVLSRLAISSSNHDRFDVNPNTGEPFALSYDDMLVAPQYRLSRSGRAVAAAAAGSERPGGCAGRGACSRASSGPGRPESDPRRGHRAFPPGTWAEGDLAGVRCGRTAHCGGGRPLPRPGRTHAHLGSPARRGDHASKRTGAAGRARVRSARPRADTRPGTSDRPSSGNPTARCSTNRAHSGPRRRRWRRRWECRSRLRR